MSDTIHRAYANEIMAVKALGDRIGYGNMMNIASALWVLMPVPESGAFIPVLEMDIKPKESKRYEAHRKELIERIKKLSL